MALIAIITDNMTVLVQNDTLAESLYALDHHNL